VVFGVDSCVDTVKQFKPLSQAAIFPKVQYFWSCLHPDKYNAQSVRGNHDYIRFMEEERVRAVACAKRHFLATAGESLKLRPASKAITFLKSQNLSQVDRVNIHHQRNVVRQRQ
jgi:hypothetical protein